MAKPRNRDEKGLRVVEEATYSEEVLRLDGKEAGKVEEVARIQLAPPPEEAFRLPQEETEADRRSHEPDIDVIIEDAKESEDLEDGWLEGQRKGPVPYGWFVLIFIGVLLAAAWSLGWFADDSEKGGMVEQARKESVNRLEAEAQEVREATAQVERVEAHVRRYAAASSILEMLPLVREPGRVEPLMRDWYEKNPFEVRPFGRMILFQPLALDTKNFFIVRYEFKGSSDAKTILVEDLGEEGTFVDWETDVCYQPMPWGQYVAERPAGVEKFRVWIEPDYAGLYSHEFQDEGKWLAIKLTALGSDEFLIGYVERRTDLETSLRELIEDNGNQRTAVVLELEVPEKVQSLRGVIIRDLVSPRWLME